MKDLPACEVIWNDAHGQSDGGWVASVSHRPQKIRTVGMLLKDDEVGVTVVLSHDKQSGHYGDYVFIPRACITLLRQL